MSSKILFCRIYGLRSGEATKRLISMAHSSHLLGLERPPFVLVPDVWLEFPKWLCPVFPQTCCLHCLSACPCFSSASSCISLVHRFAFIILVLCTFPAEIGSLWSRRTNGQGVNLCYYCKMIWLIKMQIFSQTVFLIVIRYRLSLTKRVSNLLSLPSLPLQAAGQHETAIELLPD